MNTTPNTVADTTLETTYGRLCAILVKTFNLAPEQLAPDAPLDGLGIDSLGTVELLWQVEEQFKISLPAQPPALRTLADVVRFVDQLVAQAQAQAQHRPATRTLTSASLP